MDKLVLTDTGGFPLKLDDILWENGQLDASNFGLYEAINAQLLAYGTNFIVEGCTYAAPNITAGWIMLAGELIRVSAHAGTDNYFAKVITFDARGDKTFKDTSVNSTYQVNRGVLNAASGSLNITTALRLEDKVVQLLATSLEEFAVANIPDLPVAKLPIGSSSNILSEDPNTVPSSQAVHIYIDGLTGPWLAPSYNAGFSAGSFPLQYRIYDFFHLELRGDMLSTGASGVAFTLPANYRPSTFRAIPFYRSNSLIAGCQISNSAVGNVESTNWDTSNNNRFNSLIPLN